MATLEETFKKIPPHMLEGLKRYTEHHLEPGSFLCAVISNDLVGAVNWADVDNIQILHVYVMWLIKNAPDESWGSREKLHRWLSRRNEV